MCGQMSREHGQRTVSPACPHSRRVSSGRTASPPASAVPGRDQLAPVSARRNDDNDRSFGPMSQGQPTAEASRALATTNHAPHVSVTRPAMPDTFRPGPVQVRLAPHADAETASADVQTLTAAANPTEFGGAFGTLVLTADGSSKYLGPTAASAWLKEVGVRLT